MCQITDQKNLKYGNFLRNGKAFLEEKEGLVFQTFCKTHIKTPEMECNFLLKVVGIAKNWTRFLSFANFSQSSFLQNN